MTRSLACRALHIAVAAAMALGPLPQAWAQDAPASPPSTPESEALSVELSLEQARDRIKTGDYDGAILLLKDTMAKPEVRASQADLRESYLLLIKTHVFQGNDYKFKPQGRTASDLSYGEARRLIEECLRTPGLQHTTPEPETEYPPEMIRLFDDVRREIFGALRVRGVSPAGAVVYLDGDTLQALPSEDALGVTDLPAGIHLVTVEHPGYETITDRISIAPNSTIERSYSMMKRRGTGWYATRVGLGLAVVGGLAFALLSGSDESSELPPEPLPGPPPPPASAGR